MRRLALGMVAMLMADTADVDADGHLLIGGARV